MNRILFFLQTAISATEIALAFALPNSPEAQTLVNSLGRLLTFQMRIQAGEEISDEELVMPGWDELIQKVKQGG